MPESQPPRDDPIRAQRHAHEGMDVRALADPARPGGVIGNRDRLAGFPHLAELALASGHLPALMLHEEPGADRQAHHVALAVDQTDVRVLRPCQGPGAQRDRLQQVVDVQMIHQADGRLVERFQERVARRQLVVRVGPGAQYLVEGRGQGHHFSRTAR